MANNPNYLNMVLNDPKIKPLLDANPQMRAVISNPQMLRTLMNSQSGVGGNPNALGGLGNLGGSSGNPQNAFGLSAGARPNESNLLSGLGNLNIGNI